MQHNNIKHTPFYPSSLVLQLLPVKTDLTHFSSFYPCKYKGTNSPFPYIEKQPITTLITIYETAQSSIFSLGMGKLPNHAGIVSQLHHTFLRSGYLPSELDLWNQQASATPPCQGHFALCITGVRQNCTLRISAEIKALPEHLQQLLQKTHPSASSDGDYFFSSALEEHIVNYNSWKKKASYNPPNKFTALGVEKHSCNHSDIRPIS